jgi:hypothetical protein
MDLHQPKKKHEARKAKIVSSQQLADGGQRIVTKRVIAKYRRNVTEPAEEDEDNLLPEDQDHEVQDFINDEENDQAMENEAEDNEGQNTDPTELDEPEEQVP